MNKPNGPVGRIRTGLVLALLAALTGCVAHVRGGYGATYVEPGPDVYIFGGPYERGRDVHVYSHRGSASRTTAHAVQGRPERGH